MGERCGGEGITSAGLVDLGDRPTLADQPARAYLSDEATVGVRRPAGPDGFEPFAGYARQRLVDDPHLWATALHDELVELGYGGSYPSLTRALRARELRPHCEPCATVQGRDVGIIAHPAGEETQFDWLGATRSRAWRVSSQIGGRLCRVRSS